MKATILIIRQIDKYLKMERLEIIDRYFCSVISSSFHTWIFSLRCFKISFTVPSNILNVPPKKRKIFFAVSFYLCLWGKLKRLQNGSSKIPVIAIYAIIWYVCVELRKTRSKSSFTRKLGLKARKVLSRINYGY